MTGRRLLQTGAVAAVATVALALLLSRRDREDPPGASLESDAVVSSEPRLAQSPPLTSPGTRDAPNLKSPASENFPLPRVRKAAVPTAIDIPAAIEALKSPDESVRAEAGRTLATAGVGAVDPLLAAVRRDVAAGQGLSTFAIAAMVSFDGLAEVGAPSLARAISDTDSRMNFWCVATFNRLGALRKDARAAVPILQEHLRGGGDRPVQAAAEALGSIGSAAQAAVPDLARCLRAEQVQTRIEAAKALGRFGAAASSALSDLRPLEGDASPTVRRVAAEAIVLIEGH